MNRSALTAISVAARKLRAQRGELFSEEWRFVLVFAILATSWPFCLPVRAVAQAEIGFPQSSSELRLTVTGNQVARWRQGAWEILHVSGNASIEQGRNRYAAREAIMWIDTTSLAGQPSDVLLYLEQDVVIEVGEAAGSAAGQNRYTDVEWFGRIRTASSVEIVDPVVDTSPNNLPDVFRRAMQRRNRELYPVQPAQYVAPTYESGLSLISPLTGGVQQTIPLPATPLPPAGANGFVSPFNSPPGLSSAAQTTDVRIISRNQQTGGNLKGRPGQVPGEQIQTLTGGIRVEIDSEELLARDQMGQPKTSRLVIQADNVVRWQNSITNADGSSGSRDEIYLEGNVIFAMGNRVIYADRMYYDATFRRGTILAADVITPVPSYQGLLRLKADVIQQTGEDQYQAYGAAVTSSRLGVPRYWLQSDNVTLTGQDRPIVDPATGMMLVDPQTGQPGTGKNYFVESNSNTVYLGGVPVFYWPTLRTDLDNPSYYIERIRVGNDAVFGSQFGVGLDMFQLLGIRNRAEDLKWVGLVDYLSERGLGFGSDFDYRTSSFFGIPGQTDGYIRSWFINDSGLDNLGRDRLMVPLEEDFRGRFQLRQRQVFAPGFSVRSEVGYLSDRNFLEQYYEREWDQQKDYTTGIWLERNIGNQSFNLNADARINDFFTQTQWLPRGDHFILGQPLLFERAVWHGHSTIGYGQFKTASTPTNPVDLAKFDPLAWEGIDRQGVVASTRHELDFPVQLGPVKVVPYVLGDASFWQQDLMGNELFRTYGQAGIRSSLPMWSVDPTMQSTLLNINGLAHKVSWDNEFLYANSSDSFDGLPLYNQLDDDAQEFFRRRFAFDTFGITAGMGENAPLRFDERYYAQRFGIQSYVTSPSPEIADDLTLFRTGFRNRWQTKRGIPGEARIIDLVSFDIFASVFPDPDRDNFGEQLGMIDYDFSWYVGDRLSLVSDGHFDVFDQGLRTASVGANMSRPGVGNLYVGVRAIEGPISSNILTAAASYRMSDKWIVQGSTETDFGDAGNIGQQLGFVRIGESFLVRFGVNADISRDNFGFAFGIEPRFLPDGRLGWVGGRRVAPASATYLE